MRTLLSLLILSSTIFSATLGLEIKGGVAISSLHGEDLDTQIYDNRKPHVSGTGGVALPISFTKVFTLQPEIIYNQRGAKLFGPIQKEVSRHYLDIPLLARFNLNSESILAPYLYVGPTLSLLLGAQETSFDDTPPAPNPREYVENIDIAITFGGGIQVQAGIGAILIDLRYSRGFISTFDDEEWDNQHSDPEEQIGDELTVKNITMGVMLGYAFEF